MSTDHTPPTGKDERDSNTFSNRHDKRGHPASRAHRIVVRDTRHDPPDARKLAEVVVSFAESLAVEHYETRHSTDTVPAENPPAAA